MLFPITLTTTTPFLTTSSKILTVLPCSRGGRLEALGVYLIVYSVGRSDAWDMRHRILSANTTRTLLYLAPAHYHSFQNAKGALTSRGCGGTITESAVSYSIVVHHPLAVYQSFGRLP